MNANARVFGLQVFPAGANGSGLAVRRWLDEAQQLIATALRMKGLEDWPEQKSGRRLTVELDPVRGEVPIRGVKANRAGWEASLKDVESLSSLWLQMWDGHLPSFWAEPPLVSLHYRTEFLEGSMALIQLSFSRDFLGDDLLSTVQSGLKSIFHRSALGLPIQSGAIGYATDDEPEMDEAFKYAAESAWEMTESVPGCHWGLYVTDEHLRHLDQPWSRLETVVDAIEPLGGPTGPWFVQATSSIASPNLPAAWCQLLQPLRLRWDEMRARSLRYPVMDDEDSDAGIIYETVPRIPRLDWQRSRGVTVTFRQGWDEEEAMDPAFVDLDFTQSLKSDQITSIVEILSRVADWVHTDGQVSFISTPNVLSDARSMELWIDAGGVSPEALKAVANQIAFEVEAVAPLYRLSVGGPPAGSE
jgi:hypothetical protein